jgi:hypothetical protein
MAAYVQITSGEMAEFMSALGFQELSVRERTPERMLKQSRAVKESVFEKPVGAGKIRIYSTVQGGQGRKVGRDAIRVQYWVDGVKVYGATRVHRVTNWRKNLLNRIYEIEDMVSTGALRQVPKDSSGRPMVVRSARRDKSKFWGSSDYPRNRETRRFESSVILPKKPTTAVEKAVMWKRAIEIADLQYMMMELENKVRLGIINEEDLMKGLQEKFGADDWQESDGTWVVNDEIMIPSRACDECESEMEIFSVDYDKRNKSIVEITYVCECLVKAAEYTTVTNSPLGEIVQDESGRRFVLLDEAFAQIIFEQSNKSFNAEWRESELLYPEEIESLMAIGSPNSKVFYAVRLEGDETAEYIVQQEEIDEDLMYRILLVLEEELEPVKSFAAVSRNPVILGGLDEIDAMLGRKSRNQPQESELTQENTRMRELIREGRAVYTRKGWVEIEPKKTSWNKGNVQYVKIPIVGQEIEANKKFLRKQLNAEDRDEEERMTRVEAEALADKMITALEPYVDFSEVCGSFRRGRKDPGDLDVVIIMKPGESLPEIIDKLSGLYTAINWLGEKKTQIIVDGVKVDIKVSNAEGIGAALLYFTGPSGYNIGMRRSAKKRGLKLNEYGIWNRDTNEYLGGATEEEIYDVLGKTYKPPEMRAEEEKEYYIRYRPKFAMGYLLEGPFSNLEKAQDEARLMSLFKQKHRGVLGIQEGKTYPPNYVLTKSFCKMCGADSENPCVCMIGPEVKPCTNKVLKKWKSDAIAHFPCPCSIKMEKNAESEEEEDEEPLDDDEYWEPYWEAVEEYWRMCDAYVAEAGESYQGMVQHINFWQEVAEASSHSLNYVLEKAWKFKYDALRMIYNGDAVSGHEWVLEQLSKKDYELLDDFNPENRDYDGGRGLPVYVDTNYSPGVPTLTWLKDNLNPWYLRREEGKPYAFDLYR